MNLQNLEYVRRCVSLALANIAGATKGQLDAFQGAALVNTSRYPRKPVREVGGQVRIADPVKCTETRGGKDVRPPIEEIVFCLSSWRRAISKLDGHQLGWIRYCYAHDLNYDYQVLITKHVWEEFKKTLAGKRLTKKVTARLAQLVWLAVQQHARKCSGIQGKEYTATQLADFMGVSKSTWSECYGPHWGTLLVIVMDLDCASLDQVSKSRDASRLCNLAS
ncbi:antitermination protein [Hafnia phage yong2]|uniref:bacteriophage antitermination protein Q n=1 Tax=Hafnia paralvei TaxID=546367 RepID=UPI001C56D4BF|nr:bacteriophage antitermination protein Q [Hafnia paralvei]MBW2958088.1 bacteriophage antitermination protein Q [Hafnia paralvei]QXN68773.1 antitermination protein [Hafnia phage yong2]